MAALLTIGEYRPDVSDHNAAYTASVSNVLPRGDGYGPFFDANVFSDALGARCRGLFFGTKSDGTIKIFAGTADRLYTLDNTTLTWTDASAGGSAYSTVPTEGLWSFAQFNDKIIATQPNDDVQVFDIDTDTEFANLAGSPPRASYVSVVNRFLVLSGLASNANRVQWSGLNAITTWTSGTTYSDFQDLPDGGNVLGVVGGEFGVILQESSIRRMIFSPGSDIVFQIDRLSKELGAAHPYQIVDASGRVFFFANKGFYTIDASGSMTPIGRERVDRTFLDDYDATDHSMLQAAADPRSNRVFFAYKSQANALTTMDKALVYDYILDRWSPVDLEAEIITSLAKPGITLEGLALIGSRAVSNALTGGGGGVPGVPLGLTLLIATVSSAPGGGIRLTVSSTSGWSTGDIKTVAGVTGTTEANGTWTITVVDGTTIDLDGSTFTNAYVSGGYIEGSIDDLGISLDDFEAATRPDIAIANSDHKIAFFTGDAVEATVETAEQSAIDKRLFVRGGFPVTDAGTLYASVGRRENMYATPSYTSETLINTQGFCPQRASTRHARFKMRVPAGTDWSFITGVQPDVVAEGRR
jgi:hypothetical protein